MSTQKIFCKIERDMWSDEEEYTLTINDPRQPLGTCQFNGFSTVADARAKAEEYKKTYHIEEFYI